MNLQVVTVYRNMTEEHLRQWCEAILKEDPDAKGVIDELMESGHVVIEYKDPASNAIKLTSFKLEGR